jgi:hypothetical protein
MRAQQRLFACGLALLVAACGQEQAPTAPAAGNLDLTANALGGPLNPGQSMVYRYDATDVFVAVNGDGTLLSINGAGTTDLPNSVLCGGAEFEAMTAQQVIDQTINGFRIGQEVHQIVMAIPASCANTPLAVGTGNFRLHDNDVIFSGTRMNSWGWTANGTLHDPVTGDAYQYRENQLFVARRGFPASPGWINEEITLTPIGD